MSSLLAIWAIAQIVLGISFLIFVHELGHFLVARWFGVRCEQFAIGFGPKIFAFTRGDTEYRIGWIPLGGYVRMAGEHPGDEMTGADDELQSKSVAARAAIFSAGVAMNLLAAVFLFAVAFSLGVRFISPEVGDAPPGSPAWHAGLVPGDKIIKIDGKEILNFDQIALAVAFADAKQGLKIELERDGERIVRRVYPEYQTENGVQWIGIWPPSRERIKVSEDTPAWKAGLRTGDRIVAVGDTDNIDSNRRVLEALSMIKGKTFEVSYERDGEIHHAKIETEGQRYYALGVEQADTIVREVRKFSVADGKSPSVARRLGLLAQDRLSRLGGQPIYSLRRTKLLVENWPKAWGERIELVLIRGKDKQVKLMLKRDEALAFFNGIAPRRVDPMIGVVQPGLPAAAAKMTPGSRVVELDGNKVATWLDMAKIIRESEGKPIKVGWTDAQGKRHDKEITPAPVTRVAGEVGFEYGWQLSDEVRYGVGKACLVGLQHSWDMTIKVTTMVRALLTRKVSAKNLGGPILIAKVSYAYIDQFGFGRFLYFLGLLSVNLVVLNLLPIPVLDGGHLLFLAIEAVKGAPVSETTMGIAHYIGFFLILALIIFVMANDVLRLMV